MLLSLSFKKKSGNNIVNEIRLLHLFKSILLYSIHCGRKGKKKRFPSSSWSHDWISIHHSILSYASMTLYGCAIVLSLFLCYNYLTRSSEHRISIRSFLSLLALSLLGVFLLILSISFLPSPSFFLLFSSSGFSYNQARKKRERDREREGILSRQQHQWADRGRSVPLAQVDLYDHRVVSRL